MLRRRHVDLQMITWVEAEGGYEGGDSVELPVDRAPLSSRWGGAGEALLCVFWAGAVLAVVVGRRRSAGRCRRGGWGLGLLLKVRYDDRQVPNRHLQVLGAAPVNVF